MIARVRGTRRENVLPCPGSESISSVPPNSSRLLFTTSMPTPRPDSSVTSVAVENPGSVISPRISLSPRRASSAAVRIPFCKALRLSHSGSIPRPSSPTSMQIWPPTWRAFTLMRPAGGLPARVRWAGGSMPWSQQLRIKCVSGSESNSITLLSSSTSVPVIVRSIDLSSCRARSRTMRGSGQTSSPPAACGSA